MKKVMLISSFTLLLGACTSGESTNSEKKTDSEPEIVNVEVPEDSIVPSEITTTFKPEVTELRTLTEEDYDLYEIIMDRLKKRGNTQTDQYIVYDLANEYGKEPEEFYENWIEIVNSVFYGNNGEKEVAVLPLDMQRLESDVVHKIIDGNITEIINRSTNIELSDAVLSSYYRVMLDEEDYGVRFKLKFKEDYSEAKLIELHVNGEEIVLN